MADYFLSPKAKIGKNVFIGPGAVIEDEVVIGDDCYIDAHVKVANFTTIGARTRLYLGAFVGAEPQDHRCVPGIKAPTIIGDDTVIREYVTIHRSPFEGAVTSVGNNTLLMAFAHLGHDCKVGNNVTIVNHTSLSGHMEVEDGAVFSGYCLLHQFTRVGALAMVGPRAILRQDVPPFSMISTEGYVVGVNVVGLRRAGFSNETRLAIRKAIKTLYFKGLNTSNAIKEIKNSIKMLPEIAHFIDFVEKSERGVLPGDPRLASLGKGKEDDADE